MCLAVSPIATQCLCLLLVLLRAVCLAWLARGFYVKLYGLTEVIKCCTCGMRHLVGISKSNSNTSWNRLQQARPEKYWLFIDATEKVNSRDATNAIAQVESPTISSSNSIYEVQTTNNRWRSCWPSGNQKPIRIVLEMNSFHCLFSFRIFFWHWSISVSTVTLSVPIVLSVPFRAFPYRRQKQVHSSIWYTEMRNAAINWATEQKNARHFQN